MFRPAYTYTCLPKSLSTKIYMLPLCWGSVITLVFIFQKVDLYMGEGVHLGLTPGQEGEEVRLYTNENKQELLKEKLYDCKPSKD